MSSVNLELACYRILEYLEGEGDKIRIGIGLRSIELGRFWEGHYSFLFVETLDNNVIVFVKKSDCRNILVLNTRTGERGLLDWSPESRIAGLTIGSQFHFKLEDGVDFGLHTVTKIVATTGQECEVGQYPRADLDFILEHYLRQSRMTHKFPNQFMELLDWF